MAKSSKPPFLNEVEPINSLAPNLLHRYDPVYVKYYQKYHAGRLGTHEVPVEDYRKDPLKYHVLWGRQIVDDDGLLITDQSCPVEGGEITVRIVRKNPALSIEKNGKYPVYINYHGGGWVFGNLETDHDFCKRLAQEMEIVTFNVDYRLAPENKFPIPLNDCWAAFKWVCTIYSPSTKDFNFKCNALTAIFNLGYRDQSIRV
jgi:acetyl esterase/lipase